MKPKQSNKKNTKKQTNTVKKSVNTSDDYIRDKKNQEYRMFNLLGSEIPINIKKQVEFDDEAAWSFTNQQIANNLCEKLLTLPDITPDSQITDATASVGGNVISFAKYFSKVTAIELNSIRAKMLTNNVKLFGLTNVTIYNDYAQNIIPTIHTDILFVDPPWAPHGINYKDSAIGTLTINLLMPDGKSMQSFEEFLIDVSQYTKYIVCKLPINYNFIMLEKTISGVANVATVVDKIFHGRPNSSVIYILRVN